MTAPLSGAPATADGTPPLVLLLGAGNSIHVRRWAGALAGRGHRVVVLSWVPAEPIPGVELRVAGGAGRARPTWRWAACRLPATGWWFRQQIHRIRPDVVHVHSVGTAGLLSLVAPQVARRVVTPWGSDLRIAARSRWRAWVAGAALRRADLVVPTSRSVTEEVTRRYRVPADRATTLSWGVDDDLIRARDAVDRAAVRAAFGIPADATVVLSMRTAAPLYRTDEILDAFRRAAPLRPDLHLVLLRGLAPAGALAAQQRCLARAHDVARALPGRITVVDRAVSPTEMFALMRTSAVAVSVPRWDQRSTTVLEAALAGCRLVLADLPAYRELVSDGLLADLVPEPLGPGLAEALLRARPLTEADQQAHRHLIETRESWSHQVEAMRQLYRTVTGWQHVPDAAGSPAPR
ncbi:glycosyltransferase family 4 protein [Micromonospora echinofusca]|uniref:Glycosyltransferase n=1 Tax=Micromonospora echinofusca TaxID=47858 RepID=A0ABS3VMS1_MICEH|nr:glycosyltransferase family 4 protein [Micromonospora echinofusca]MBO4205812.1 glycosyltransferase [Micromonospora echinofusca]